MKNKNNPIYYVEPRDADTNWNIWSWIGGKAKSENVECADGIKRDMYVCTKALFLRIKREHADYCLRLNVFIQKNKDDGIKPLWSSIPKAEKVESLDDGESIARSELADVAEGSPPREKLLPYVFGSLTNYQVRRRVP